MSLNARIAAIFEEMARLLELTGANSFRVNAHSKVARVLDALSVDAGERPAEPAKLTELEGIGESSAKKIVEFVLTGRVEELEKLRAAIPAGLLDVMKVPGLGPKTVKLMWEQAGVVDLPTLRARLAGGELESLPRMGAKTLQNIRDSLEFLEKASERMRLGEAMPIAEEIVERMRAVKGVKQAVFAGSLRRGKETIGDIDILVVTDDPAATSEAFRTMPGVTKVLVQGENKSSVRLDRGTQVDLRVIEASIFGGSLMYFTGSKEHNIRIRECAIRMGMRLNEYGLFHDEPGEGSPQDRGLKPIVAATEEEIYAKLDLPWIPPELREDRGELDAKLPRLIELGDIGAELHAHTTASDGTFSIEELVLEAKRRGRHTIAITDHSRSSVQANGLSAERLREHIAAVRAVAKKHRDIQVLAGSEVDIHIDGSLDYDDDLLAELDIVIASPHASLRQDPETATKRLLAAIAHPLVHVIGHPTGRIINQREGLSPDIGRLVAAAVRHDTALEINANYLRLDLRDTHVRAAVDAGALIAIDTDAHHPEHFDFLRYGVLTGRRGWLTAAQCVNTWSAKKLREWLGPV